MKVIHHLKQSFHHKQKNTQFFYRPDILPVAQLTVSEHWREITDKWLLIVIPSIFIDELDVLQSATTATNISNKRSYSPQRQNIQTELP